MNQSSQEIGLNCWIQIGLINEAKSTNPAITSIQLHLNAATTALSFQFTFLLNNGARWIFTPCGLLERIIIGRLLNEREMQWGQNKAAMKEWNERRLNSMIEIVNCGKEWLELKAKLEPQSGVKSMKQRMKEIRLAGMENLNWINPIPPLQLVWFVVVWLNSALFRDFNPTNQLMKAGWIKLKVN